MREYVQRLWPHRLELVAVLLMGFVVVALQMIEPLFLRFIIDGVLLNDALDPQARLFRLHALGAAFLSGVLSGFLLGAYRQYRERVLSARIMMRLRTSTRERLLARA